MNVRFLVLLCLSLLLAGCSTFNPIASKARVIPVERSETLFHVPQIDLALNPPAVVERTIPLHTELHYRAQVRFTDSEIRCMADAIYYEARGERLEGQIAVGYVILNRMAHQKFAPSSICGVVQQSHRFRSGRRVCQFSWYCTHGGTQRRNPALYEQTRALALQVMRREVENPINDSVFFHARTVRPAFRRYSVQARIDNHIFYSI